MSIFQDGQENAEYVFFIDLANTNEYFILPFMHLLTFVEQKSKRMPAKRRYKIEKKVKEHNRKLRRIDKQKKKSKYKKTIIVPGNCPFKDDILLEALEIQKAIQLKKQLKKDESKANRAALKMLALEEKKNFPLGPTPKLKGEARREAVVASDDANNQNNRPAKGLSFEELLRKAKERGYQFEKMEEIKAQRDPSLKAFYREFQQVWFTQIMSMPSLRWREVEIQLVLRYSYISYLF